MMKSFLPKITLALAVAVLSTTTPTASGLGNIRNWFFDNIFDAYRLRVVTSSGTNAASYALQECEGDCRPGQRDCDLGLNCYAGDGAVPGCLRNVFANGNGAHYCYVGAADELTVVAEGSKPASAYPLKNCQGECVTNDDCGAGLECGTGPVPGCKGDGFAGIKYCFETNTTYVPGLAVVSENGLLLSHGLKSRIIAVSGQPVSYDNGTGQSTEAFHALPDGATVFQDPSSSNYKYVSNSEVSSGGGGVGAITFDQNGKVIGYEKLLSGTSGNCGVGTTFWNTWLSCEEVTGGQIWEVDPFGTTQPQQTVMGGAGAKYEAATFDNRDSKHPTFYATNDSSGGPLLKFTPTADAVATGDMSQLLHVPGDALSYQYLVVHPGRGTFVWTTNIAQASVNARLYYQNCEGLNVHNGVLYMTCKVNKQLFILDLDKQTYSVSSTVSGAFDGQPDQVARLLDSNSDILYFCEDVATSAGVHVRDSNGKYYTILQGEVGVMDGETTGLTFSPGNQFLYVAFQHAGKLFEISRADGKPFSAQPPDIMYHDDPNNAHPFTTP